MTAASGASGVPSDDVCKASMIFFAVAIIDRLLPIRWILGAAKSENYMAIFAEAKMAAATYTPFAFMG